MKGILADANIQGYLEMLVHVWQGPVWNEIWTSLGLSILTFEELGLNSDVADNVLWHVCQQHQIILITRNRNARGPDSLEATIRTFNAPDSLPVFTLADPERIPKNKAYAGRVAEGLLQYLLEIDRVRGTGRLYLP